MQPKSSEMPIKLLICLWAIMELFVVYIQHPKLTYTTAPVCRKSRMSITARPAYTGLLYYFIIPLHNRVSFTDPEKLPFPLTAIRLLPGFTTLGYFTI